MKFRWPRGRYNGKRIAGFSLKVGLDLIWWHWKPVCRWNFGQPFVWWLCFNLRAEPVYHFND